MEFLRVVEEELRGLAAEARRRYPVVQEAAERAILKLRNMREEYVAALRQQHEGKAPPLSMFRSQDLLRPFLLACNHGDASPHLMNMAMGSIQYLINRDAILPSDSPNILRVLAIQSQSKDADVQKRVLQTMVMVVTWKSCDMTEDTISQAMGVCLGLHDAKNAMVRTAADMTVRQVISLLFDRVAEELGVPADQPNLVAAAAPVAKEASPEGRGQRTGEGALRCAHLVFQDLCILSRGEQGQWMKRASVTTTLGLELVEQVLSQQPMLFRRFEGLRRLLSQEVSPLILQTLRRRMEFPLLVRLLRAASTLCVGYGDLLPGEARAILSTMLISLGTGVGTNVALAGDDRDGDGSIRFSEASAEGSGAKEGGSVTWAAMLTLEAVHRVLTATPVVLALFRYGGGGDGGSGRCRDEAQVQGADKCSVVEEMLQALSRYLLKNLSSQHSVQALEAMAQSIRLSCSSGDKREARKLPVPTSMLAALARDAPPAENKGGATSGGMRGTKGGAGAPAGDNKLWSSGSSSRGAKSSSAELLHETEKPSLDDAELLLWALQCTVDFSSAMLSLVEEEFGESTLSPVIPSSCCRPPKREVEEEAMSINGTKRDTLRRMCERLWEPTLSSLSHVMAHCSEPLLVGTAVDGYKAFTVAAAVLGVENAVDGFMGSLCHFSLPQWHGTANMMGLTGGGGQGGTTTALTWNHVGILQAVLQVAHRLGNLLRSSWHVILDTLEQAVGLLIRRAIAKPKWSPHLLDTELEEVERHCEEVLEAAERLVQFSTCLEDEALYTLMSSLQALTVMGLANTATVLPQERNTSRELAQRHQNGPPSGGGGGAGSAAVAAATGLVSFVGAAARGVGAAMSEGRDAIINRDKDSYNQASANVNVKPPAPGTGEVRTHNPWVSSRLVVECAAANTWRLPVVWELVSGHLRVVAKAREPGTREYAVRALRELIVDGVQRLHPETSPSSRRQLQSSTTATTPRSATHARASSATPSISRGGATSAVLDEGFIPNLLGFRGRSGEIGGEDEHCFRWVFDSDVSGVFVAERTEIQAHRTGLVASEGDSNSNRGQFEGVLFETMGLFALTPHLDTREAMLQTLYTILQSCGQVLDSAWAVILNLLHSVAKGATDTPPPSAVTPSEGKEASGGEAGEEEDGEEEEEDGGFGNERVFTWGGACLSLAFKGLQLIVDDFLERVPLDQVPKLVTCVGAFGGQTESVNLSLTAIGMLWTVCDTFADATPNLVTSEGTRNDNDDDDDDDDTPANHEDRHSLQSLWASMLLELRSLAVDFRPELRNCAVNTLFSAAVRNGSRLSEEEWKQFLLEVTFPLINQVLKSTNSASRGANTAVAPELKKGVRMLMHHTRDTDQKQWNETRVLAMQGLGRVLRAYVGHLTRWEWFSKEEGVWARSLQLYREACLVGSDSQEVALAGIDGMTNLVLLVGRTGFNSVRVRAGAGMKIVDGTLQRDPAGAPSSGVSTRSIGNVKSPRAGGGGGARGSTAIVTATAAGTGTGTVANLTPEFIKMRPNLYEAAWEAMFEASRFEADNSGDVAPAFVQALAAVYKAGMEEAEFCPGQEGEPKRTQQMFQILDGLFLPRVPQHNRSPSPTEPASRRTVYVPKVTSGQRAILDFLQEDLRSGWSLALRLLAKYSVAAEDPEPEPEPEPEEAGEVRDRESRGGGGGGRPATARGGMAVMAVTRECRKEVTAALSAMMSDRLRVPSRDRARALEGLLSEVSGPCVRRLDSFQRRSQLQSRSNSTPLGTATDTTTNTSTTRGSTAETPGEEMVAALRWPSRARCTEVMRLLLALLSEGLACLSSEKGALYPQDGYPAASSSQRSSAAQDNQTAEASLVRTYAVAVKAIGAVSDCYQWGSLGQEQQLLSAAAGREAGAASDGRGEFDEGFPQLSYKALALVTEAVRTDIVPLVRKGRDDAKDVARALIDTLGIVACSVKDLVPRTPWAAAPQTEVLTAEADEPAQAMDAFELAVGELLAMNDGGVEGGDWAKLGLPLRRRACWHLLRCVWTTARYFRCMEDALINSNINDMNSDGRGEEGLINAGDAPNIAHALRPLAHRCTHALKAIGELRLPPALLTTHLKKLIATKQAQEAERPLDIQNPWDEPEANGQASAGAFVERALTARREVEHWATMSENQTGDQDSIDADNGIDNGAEEYGVGTRSHLMLACRVLLMCSASRTDGVRKEAAALLAEADIPRALNVLQDEVASLKRDLRQREAQLHHAEAQVQSLRAQVAAGAFML